MKMFEAKATVAAAMLAGLGLIAITVSLSGQDYVRTEISEVFRGLRFTDGIAWSPAGYLVFSDVPSDRLLRYAPGGQVTVMRENAGGASGNAFDGKGRLYTAESTSRQVSRTVDGERTTLAAEWQGKRLNAPNDIAVRRNGDVYFTDPAYGSAVKSREIPEYGVYRISDKGEISLVKGFATRVNGIAFSPDEDTLYVTDSDRRLVLALELNGKGELKDVREFASTPDAIPAGLCVDKKGSVYVAAGAIRVFDKKGAPLGKLNTPHTPSDCTFGEEDGKALFVTARGAVFRLQNPVEGLLPR